MPTFVAPVLRLAFAVFAIGFITTQCRKPAWWPGRLFLGIMNRSHRSVTTWGLEHLAIAKDSTLLDVGCGGGRTIHTLATIADEGTVYGIDYSAASVAASTRTNAAEIQAGRVDVRLGTVSHLPYRDEMFDAVTAIETFYYWPNPVADLREIIRVLKPGGQLLIVAETYKGRRFDSLYRPAMMLLRATYLTPDEHRELLTSAGFSAVEVFEEPNKGWLCAVGRKPAVPASGPSPGERHGV
jgi:ubiquinone/menaquinone biosynthesis C-methylase UbiE